MKFAERELKAVTHRKPLLPHNRGEVRYQSALDQDKSYREMVLGAVAIALFAGSGFGHLGSVAGPWMASLVSLTIAGFGIRMVVPKGFPENAGTYFVKGSVSRLLISTIFGFGILCSLLSGWTSIEVLTLACGQSLLVILANIEAKFNRLTNLIGSLALLYSCSHLANLGGQLLPGWSGIGLLIGMMLCAICILENARHPDQIRSALTLSSLATCSVVILLVAENVPTSFAAWIGFGLSLLVIAFQRVISKRSSFAPIFILVVGTHLLSTAMKANNLLEPVAPQIIVVLLEFTLLGMASYRHSYALLSRYPRATYRSSPQCLVPGLDHAWEHPIKIDAF